MQIFEGSSQMIKLPKRPKIDALVFTGVSTTSAGMDKPYINEDIINHSKMCLRVKFKIFTLKPRHWRGL